MGRNPSVSSSRGEPCATLARELLSDTSRLRTHQHAPGRSGGRFRAKASIANRAAATRGRGRAVRALPRARGTERRLFALRGAWGAPGAAIARAGRRIVVLYSTTSQEACFGVTLASEPRLEPANTGIIPTSTTVRGVPPREGVTEWLVARRLLRDVGALGLRP